MLSLIIAAHCSSLIKKLILIGGGPLEQDYAKTIGQVRLSRLSDEEQPSVTKSFNILSDPLATDINKNNALKKVGALFHKTDSYAPIEETTTDDGNIETEGHI